MGMKETENPFMAIAFAEATAAAKRGEVPVGAVIVDSDGQIIAKSGNEICANFDPTAHAEINVIRAAGLRRKNERLVDCDLYVTLEPCAMCAQAISLARIRRLYYAAEDVKAGAVDNGVRLFQSATCHHAPDVYGGIGAKEAQKQLKDFFAERRTKA